jgi:hypothetical protein
MRRYAPFWRKRLGSARALPSVHFAEAFSVTGRPNNITLKRYAESFSLRTRYLFGFFTVGAYVGHEQVWMVSISLT